MSGTVWLKSILRIPGKQIFKKINPQPKTPELNTIYLKQLREYRPLTIIIKFPDKWPHRRVMANGGSIISFTLFENLTLLGRLLVGD